MVEYLIFTANKKARAMLTDKQKNHYFQTRRNHNYRASLKLEGFKSIPEKEVDLDALTPQQILKRIEKIKNRYAG